MRGINLGLMKNAEALLVQSIEAFTRIWQYWLVNKQGSNVHIRSDSPLINK